MDRWIVLIFHTVANQIHKLLCSETEFQNQAVKRSQVAFGASCRRFISFLYGLTRDPPRSRISVFLVKYFIWFYYPGLASCPPHYAVTSEKNENDDYSRQGAYHINYRHRLGNTPATNNGHVSENNDHLVHSAHYTGVLRDENHVGIYLPDP